jgi:hypothetical protein
MDEATMGEARSKEGKNTELQIWSSLGLGRKERLPGFIEGAL